MHPLNIKTSDLKITVARVNKKIGLEYFPSPPLIKKPNAKLVKTKAKVLGKVLEPQNKIWNWDKVNKWNNIAVNFPYFSCTLFLIKRNENQVNNPKVNLEINNMGNLVIKKWRRLETIVAIDNGPKKVLGTTPG